MCRFSGDDGKKIAGTTRCFVCKFRRQIIVSIGLAILGRRLMFQPPPRGPASGMNDSRSLQDLLSSFRLRPPCFRRRQFDRLCLLFCGRYIQTCRARHSITAKWRQGANPQGRDSVLAFSGRSGGYAVADLSLRMLVTSRLRPPWRAPCLICARTLPASASNASRTRLALSNSLHSGVSNVVVSGRKTPAMNRYFSGSTYEGIDFTGRAAGNSS